jgi:hypothetical protein
MRWAVTRMDAFTMCYTLVRWVVNAYGCIHHVLYTGADLASVYTCDLDLLDPMDLKSRAIGPLSADPTSTLERIHHHVLYTGADLASVYTCDLDLLDPMDLKSRVHPPDFFDR